MRTIALVSFSRQKVYEKKIKIKALQKNYSFKATPNYRGLSIKYFSFFYIFFLNYISIFKCTLSRNY